MPSTLTTVIVGAAGIIIGSVVTFIVSDRRNKFELALATWKERAEAHRKINATITRLIALTNLETPTREERYEIDQAFTTFRENNLFLERNLRDEIHEGFVHARKVIVSNNDKGSDDDREKLERLRSKLRISAGVDKSYAVLLSYFSERNIFNLLRKKA